ncbi:hypothetical protein JCM10212_004328 [Sporobolomyces blumeae]
MSALAQAQPDAASYKLPPVPPPSWTSLTASSIPDQIHRSISTTNDVLRSIVSLPPSERTFESVVRPLALRMGEMDRETEPSLFMQYVASTDAALRKASVEADKELNDWSLESLMRKDVYEALRDAKRHTDENEVGLNPEEKRLMDRLVLDRERNGLGLDDDKRKVYLDIKKRIMTLEIDFQKNCNEEAGFILFTADELKGVPEDVVAGYDKVEEDGVEKYKMTFKTPDYTPVIKSAIHPETRKRAQLGYENKTVENVPLLSEIVKLRKEAAGILGLASHAEWGLQVQMNKSPQKVLDFLTSLRTKLTPLGERERQKFIELKKEEFAQQGWEWDEARDAKLWLWDYRYYERMSVERELDLDDTLLQEYFPVSHVIPAVLEIYKGLLGVELVKVPKTDEAGGKTWDADVDMFAVWENNQVGKEGAFKGYITLDLFPRNNKYGHAAVWGLIPGWTGKDGDRQYPVVAMVANLAKPTPNRPALMKHQDVVTFFHEFGHAYHGLLSETQFAKFHGTATARDWVEAPSQMLENWCWVPSVLERLSSHYMRREPLPKALISKLIASRSKNQGLFNLRQLFFGLYDMKLHTTEYDLGDEGMTRLWNELRKDVSLVDVEKKDWVAGQSGFAHIAGGYAAGYYGYLSSQVYSTDMFATKFAHDPMDPQAGMLYRKEILKPGGSRDEMQSLVSFLGREPSDKAFLDQLLSEQ